MSYIQNLVQDNSTHFDAIEVQISEGTSSSVEIRDGEVEDVSVNSFKSLKVRVFKDNRVLYYTSSGNIEKGFENFLEDAKQTIGLLEPDNEIVIPVSHDKYEELGSQVEPSINELKDFALMTESGAKGYDNRVKSVKSSSCSYINHKTSIIGTYISPKLFNRQIISSSCHCLAEENGDIQEGYEGSSVYYGKLFDPVFAGTSSAALAVNLLGGKPLKTGRYPILFDSNMAAQFIELISELCDGEGVIKHMSLFEDKLGHKVASSILNIYDDPFHSDAIGSYQFDDEGTPAVKTPLIVGGILESYLHNCYTAKVLSSANTANAVRTGSGKVGVGVSNLIVEPTEKAENLNLVDGKVLKVLDVMGLHMVDTISGEFSLGISGLVLEKGIVVSAFRESVITGNLKDLLQSAVAVYDNVRINGNVVTGDILFDKMNVSGS
jgi:PmbA protein